MFLCDDIVSIMLFMCTGRCRGCKIDNKVPHSGEIWQALNLVKVARSPVFSGSTNLEFKLIEFFVFVNF